MEYRVLGSLDVRNGGGSLVLGSAKQRALLAVLLLNANQVVSRDRLIDELWGDEPPATAVQSVQVYVSRLRKLLPPETLLTRPPGYLLELEPDALDLEKFDRLFADGREALGAGDAERASRILHEALALWRGPALAEFAFEPFARTEIGRLDELRLAALEERIEADLALGRHADVIAELETLIADNPHRERLRGQLMLALYRSGRQAEALEAYRQTRSVLDALGIDPSERLRQLELSILTQDRALDVPHLLIHDAVALPGPLRIASPFPFVGRAQEFDTLRSMLLFSEQGEGGQVALIAGEAGSGKTRLARELAHDAAERGTLVLYGGSNVDVNVPYQPFVEALEFLVRIADPVALQTWLGNDSEIARLVPALGRVPVAPAGDADTARRLHNEFSKLLADVSRQRPLLLVVDDLQWADASSVQLLRHLTRAAPEARIFVLATYRDRSEDLRPEVSAALADFSRLEGATRLRLRALNSDDVGEFIEQSSGASAAPELTQAVHTLTEGTPFLLCELWRALVDADTVQISDGGVTLSRAVAELSSPESVRDVVHFRLSRLAPSTTEMLEVASVAGTEFDVSLLGEVASVSAADEAVESGMIEPLAGIGVAYRFSHELVRRALYDRLAPAHRADLHLRVGEALEQAHPLDRERVFAELAHHFTLAAPVEGAERAIAYNLEAARSAARSLGYDDAAKHLRTALELGIADASERARVGLDLGAAFLQSGKLPEAEAALARAIDDASGEDRDGLRAHASILRNNVRLRTDADDAQLETRRIAEDAIETFTRLGDTGGLAQAWRLLSHVPMMECRWAAAAHALEIALTHARRTGDDREVAKVVTWLVTALYYGPLPAADAIDRFGELLEDHRSDTYIHAIASCHLSGLLAMTGRFDEARAAGRRGLAALDEFGLTIAAANGRAYVSEGERFAGDAGAAERELLRAHDMFESAGDRAGTVSTTFDLAAVVSAQGRYDEAESWMARAREELEQSDVMTRVTGLSVEAELAAHGRRPAEAERYARRAVELGEETDALNVRAGAFASLGKIFALCGRIPEANTAREEAVGLYEAKGNSSAAAQLRAATGSAAPA